VYRVSENKYVSRQFIEHIWDAHVYNKTHYKNKLEIWGRAQREATRRRKSDWGDN